MPVSSFQTIARNDGNTQCKLYSNILLIMEYMCCAYSQMPMMIPLSQTLTFKAQSSVQNKTSNINVQIWERGPFIATY